MVAKPARERASIRQLAAPGKDWVYGESFHAVLNLPAVAQDTRYVLVDLDDTSDFPHSGDENTAVIVRGIRAHLEQLGTGIYDVLLGVLKENDGTDGSVDWFARIPVRSGSGRDIETVYPAGLNARIESGAPVFFRTNLSEADNTNWQNDAYLTAPPGSAIPEVGDIVALVDEISGSGTLEGTIEIEYDLQ